MRGMSQAIFFAYAGRARTRPITASERVTPSSWTNPFGVIISRAFVDLDIRQACLRVDTHPVLGRIEAESRAYLAEECLSSLLGRRAPPHELRREHAPAGPANPDELPCRTSSIYEHRHGLGDDDVECVIGDVESEDVSFLEVDAVLGAGPLDCLPGAFQHERLDVDRSDVGAEALCDRNCGCAYPTADVEDLAVGSDPRTAQQLLGRGSATWMDHALSDHSHEHGWIKPLYLGRLEPAGALG
jgi:hypothetical protein